MIRVTAGAKLQTHERGRTDIPGLPEGPYKASNTIDIGGSFFHYAFAMKAFFSNLSTELRGIAASPAGFLYLLIQGLLVGYNFYSAMGSYSGYSTPLEEGILPVPSLEPLRDLFVPVFHDSYLYLSLLLPIIYAGLFSGRHGNIKYNFISQFSGIGRTLCAKLSAGLLFNAVLLALSLPALLYWFMAGGDVYAGEMVLLYGGYAAWGLFIMALTVFFFSLLKNRYAAVAFVWLIVGLSFGLDYYSEVTSSCPAVRDWSIASMLNHFESGRLFIPALLYFLVPSLLLVPLSNALLMKDGKKTTIVAGLLACVLAAGLGLGIAAAAGFTGEDIDLEEHEHARASSCVVLNAERQLHPYAYLTFPGGAFTPVMPEYTGHPLVVPGKDRRDILLVYWSVIPLIFAFVLLVRIIQKSGFSRTRKRMLVAPATWLAIMASLALVQDYYVKNQSWKIFPSLREILPRWAGTAGKKIFSMADRGADEKDGANKKSVLPGDPNYIYAGKDYQHLQRFFKKLSDLQARRRNSVHVMHYGDSLIWGDCYTKTVKHRFQEEFGDGGRGVVPPVETMATALQDHVNRTAPGGFTQHAIRHEFRYLGNFYIRPDINPQIGFTGEGTFPRSPRSEIRMEAPEGSARWKQVRVFLRSPGKGQAGPSEYHVNLDHGAGREAKVLKLDPGGTGYLAWEIPESGKISVNFEGSSGGLPFVDAVDVESGSGIVYSTIVRMGIHMAWLNAVPERHLKTLRDINPDLLIFQFGINEAASLGAFPEFTKEELRSQMREWLGRLKRLLPETDILLIGPPERLQTWQGGLAAMKETLAVREVQREEAARAGIAFFDTHESLGGEGHMLRMANSGLAMKDYTHFTMRGGDIAADGFYTSLMNVYRKKNERPKLDFRTEEKTALLFNSASFAYFLAAVIIMAFLLRRWPQLRFAFILVASYYFYATWKLWPLACLAATTVTDYSMARLIHRARERGGRGTMFLASSLAINLGILFTLKYFDFFSDLTGKAANALGYQASVPILNILLPVGISFYTFQSLSYTIDVWRGTMEPEKSLVRYAHYVSLFTQLLAGPIVKAREFLPALKDRAGHFLVTHEHFSTALFLILTGLLKKAGADWLAGSIVDRVYASPHMFLPLETLTAVYAYGLQIYGDFSGYSDIAIGSAMLLGYNLTENFRRPYASASVSEFWQRWHISLGSWLRDYLYVSLGGNRRHVLLNLGITMFLCGLWHGAAIPFVVWGLYHGLLMIIERVFRLNRKETAHPFLRGLRVFITLHAVLFGWIIFRSDSWGTFTGIMNSLLQLKGGAPNVGALLAGVMVLFYALHFTPVNWKERLKASWGKLPATAQGLAAACVTLFIYNIAIAEVKPFIYFQF